VNDSLNERKTGATPDSNRASAPGIRLFLDSADPVQWERFLPLGIFYGITTNPLLLERSQQACTLENLETMTQAAARLGAREIQLQTWGNSTEAMTRQGEKLARLEGPGMDVVIKVPATEAGLEAAAKLRTSGCRITLTATYSPGQVLAAAGLGAAYAAPYLGRMNDAGKDGAAILATMRDILVRGKSSTRLLVASLRQADQVVDLARCGFDTFTFGPAVAAGLLAEELTEDAATDFQRAAELMARPKED
jgi:transaldolase